MTKIARTIKYEADLDKDFADWIVHSPGGEKLRSCIQCGTCSASCPLSIYMDLTPRRLINMARQGFKQEILSSITPWLCASCYACTVACPQQIRVTDIMYTLKRRAIEENVYPRGLPVSVLARAFFNMVRHFGRVSESYVVVALFLQTNVFKILGMVRLGLGLVRTRRMTYLPEKIKQHDDVRKMLDYLDRPDASKEVAA